MKFWLSRSSDSEHQQEEINLETLDDLLALAREEDEELIVSINSIKGGSEPSIEIYDWYRE